MSIFRNLKTINFENLLSRWNSYSAITKSKVVALFATPVLGLSAVLLLTAGVRDGSVLAAVEATFVMPGSGALQENFNGAGFDDDSGKINVQQTEVKLQKNDTWWDDGYVYKAQLTLTNTSDITIGANTTVKTFLDTQTLFGSGKVQADCDDIRVVYSTGAGSHTQLDSNYDIASGATDCSDSSETEVYFPLQLSIASSASTNDYYIYYGNPSATGLGGAAGFDIDDAGAALVCPFDGSTDCVGGTTPSTESGVVANGTSSTIAYSGTASTSDSNEGISAEESTTNKIANPSFENATFDTNWDIKKPEDTGVTTVYNAALTTGRDIVINGGFDADTNWTHVAAWTISGGTANCDGTQASSASIYQGSITLSNGQTWDITYTVSNYSAGTITGLAGGNTSTAHNANGTYTDTITLSGISNNTLGIQADVNFVGSIDDVTITQKNIPSSTDYVNSEKITNGGFDTDLTGWTNLGSPTTREVVGGRLHVLSNAGSQGVTQSIGLTAGKKYKASITYDVTGANLRFDDGGSGGFSKNYGNSSGTDEFEFTAVGSTIRLISTTAAVDFYVDRISITEVNPLDATATNVTVGQVGPKADYSYLFNGTTSIINNYSTDLNSIFNPNAGSLVLFMKVSSSGVWTDGINRYPFFLGASDQNRIYVRKANSNNTMYFRYQAGNINKEVSLGSISNTGWFMVTLTWDKTADQFKVYFDDSQVSTTQTGLGTWVGNLTTTYTNIGGATWDGYITHPVLFRDVLSEAEILDIGRKAGVISGTPSDSLDVQTTIQNTVDSKGGVYWPFQYVDSLSGTLSEESGTVQYGSKSANVNATLDTKNQYFTTKFDLGNTNDHTLSGYLNTGGTVSSSVATLVFDGAEVTPDEYLNVGNNWWRLEYSGTPTNSYGRYGILVKNGNTAYIDGVQLEEKEFVTGYTDGSLGTGYAWTGTANDSSSTRTAGDLRYSTTSNIGLDKGSVSLWFRPGINFGSYADSTTRNILGYVVNLPLEYPCAISGNYASATLTATHQADGGAYTKSLALDATNVNKWYNLVCTWDQNTDSLEFYINGTQASTSGGSWVDASTVPTDLYVGRSDDSSSYANGTVSDLRTLDDPISATEVASLYKAGLVTHSNGTEDVDRYQDSGAYTSPVLNLGAVSDWSATTDFETTQALNSGTLSFETNTSSDGSTWEGWQAIAAGEIASSPARYLRIKANYTSAAGGADSPSLTGVNINFIPDDTPPTNPTTLTTSPGVSGEWFNDTTPTFTWPRAEEVGGASDTGEGASGVKGYHVYFGTDNTAIPYSTVTDKTFIADPGTGDVEFTAPEISATGTYYLRIQAEDNAGNYPGNLETDIWSPFVYNFETTAPVKPQYIEVNPSGYTRTNEFTFTWPAGSDADSGVWGYCYKAGTGSETCEDEASLLSGSDYSKTLTNIAYQSGSNIIYVRTKDVAGNYSDYAQSTFYWNQDSPSAPLNLSANSATGCSGGDDNCWQFDWDEPLEYTENIVRYYYAVNEIPNTDSPTVTDSISPIFAAGTRQGSNTFYVTAEDVIGVTYEVNASVNFDVSTTAPGIPADLQVTDSSNRDASDWALTLKWTAPSATGSGIDHYNIFRSTNGTDYTKIAETTATGYLDTGLSNEITYYYKVSASDNAEAQSGLSGAKSYKPTGKYTSPPTFGGVPSATTTAHTATVEWSTDRLSDSYVEYGETTSYEIGRVGDASYTKVHKVVIRGLVSEQQFHFRVQSLDDGALRNYLSDEGYSEDFTFTTKQAPDITNVEISDITLNSAVVSWKTTTISNSEIQYGKNSSFGSSIEEQSGSLTTNHTVRLSSLDSGSLYQFKIVGRDADDVEIFSDNYSFSTLAFPQVSNVRMQSTEVDGQTGVLISWDTNVATTSIIKYYPEADPADSNDVFQADLLTAHEMFVTGMKDNTRYIIEVGGIDAYGNAANRQLQQFTTDLDTKPPVITDLVVETAVQGSGRNSKAQIIVSWKTNEEATSQVEYGKGVSSESYSNKTAQDGSPKTNHVVVISDLDPSTPYHVRAVSTDAARNIGISGDYAIVTRMPTNSAFDLIVDSLRNNLAWIFSW